MRSSLTLLAIATTATSLPTLNEGDASSNGCRFMPGDAGWPSADQWSQLNSSVGGQLIATVPLAAPCHDSTAPRQGLARNWPTYDEEKCAELQDSWLEPELQCVLRSLNKHISNANDDLVTPIPRASWHRTLLTKVATPSSLDPAHVSLAHTLNIRSMSLVPPT